MADDLVLFSTRAEKLQQMIDELNEKGEEVGLKINIEKTKVMTNGLENSIAIDGHDVDYVTEFAYLGQLISFEDRQDKEIGRRTQNAWKAYWKLRKYLISKNIEMRHRRRLFDMCILPVLTYGSPTWSLTKKQQEKLKVTQRAMERRMLGVTRRDRLRNEEIRRRTQTKDVAIEAANLKWSWAGHLARRNDERWTLRATEWQPRHGTRNRGRPRRRWRDEFPGWQMVARDRRKWSNVRREAVFQFG